MAEEKINVATLFKLTSSLANDLNTAIANGTEDIKSVPELKEKMTQIEYNYNNVIFDFIRFYLIQARDVFYGSMLSKLETGIDWNQRGSIDTKISTSLGGSVRLTVNPLFAANLSFQELIGLVISEVLGLAYDHPTTYADSNPGKDQRRHDDLIKAGQAEVSELMKNEIFISRNCGSGGRYGSSPSSSTKGFKIPEELMTVPKLNNHLKINPKDRETIAYYYKLLQRDDIRNDSPVPLNGRSIQNDQPQQGQNPASPNNSQGSPIHQWETSDSVEERSEMIKKMVDDVYSNMDSESRGYLPLSLVAQIKKLLTPPEIDWKAVFKQMIGNVPASHKRTKMKPNRRQPWRYDLPGSLTAYEVLVVVCIDTSGSMSDSDIEYVITEILNMTKHHKTKIVIVECDAEVGRVYEIKSMKDVQTTVTGRGGTRFTPAIEYINGKEEYKKLIHSGKFKNALMVYFTDGYGEYSIPRPKTYKNLWVVLKDEKNLSVENPYGKVKALYMDKDYQKRKKGGSSW